MAAVEAYSFAAAAALIATSSSMPVPLTTPSMLVIGARESSPARTQLCFGGLFGPSFVATLWKKLMKRAVRGISERESCVHCKGGKGIDTNSNRGLRRGAPGGRDWGDISSLFVTEEGESVPMRRFGKTPPPPPPSNQAASKQQKPPLVLAIGIVSGDLTSWLSSS